MKGDFKEIEFKRQLGDPRTGVSLLPEPLDSSDWARMRT